MSFPLFATHAALFLLDIGLKSLALFTLAGLACLAMRGASAASRHALWLLTLAGLLCLPVLDALLPAWGVAILPAVPGAHTARTDALPMAALPREQARIVPPRPEEADNGNGRAAATDPPARSDAPAPMPASVSSVRPSAVRWSAATWVCLAWLFGALLVGARTLFALRAAQRLVRRCRPVGTGPLVEAANVAREALGLTQPLSVWEGTSNGPVAVPMTMGVLRPVVLLPQGAAGWPAGRLRAVLLHEAAHVKRLDWAAMVFARTVCAFYWWHPLAWLAASRLREESETTCDDLVLACGVPAPDYASHLLEIVQTLASRPTQPTTVVAMAHRREVGSRLRAILDGCRNRQAVTRRGLAVATIGVIVLLGPLAMLHPVGAAAGHPSPGESQNDRKTAMAPDSNLPGIGPWREALLTAKTSPWKATLPNGVQVMLGEVWALTGTAAGKQWSPAGPLLEDFGVPPYYRRTGATVCNISFLLLFPSQGLKDSARVSFGQAGERPGGGTDLAGFQVRSHRDTSYGPPLVIMGNQERFRPSLERTDLTVHVATGPETILLSAPPSVGATRRLTTGEVVSVSSADVSGAGAVAQFVFLIPARYVRDQSEYKISLLGPDGLPLHVPNGSQTYPVISGGMARITYAYRTEKLPLSRVTAVRLTYRPSQTAVFRNVALRPTAPVVPVPAVGFRRYISKPLPDGTRYTFLYPSYLKHISPGWLDNHHQFITVHLDSIGNSFIPWTPARGREAIMYRLHGKGGASWPAPHEEFVSVVVGRAGAYPGNWARKDVQWVGENGNHHTVSFTDARTGMRFQLIHEDRYIPALFQQTDPVIARSFRVLPSASPRG